MNTQVLSFLFTIGIEIEEAPIRDKVKLPNPNRFIAHQ